MSHGKTEAVYIGARLGYTYFRNSHAIVRLSAVIAGSLGLCALSWSSTYKGFNAWIANGPSWHAAVTGFMVLGASAALSLWHQPAAKNPN